MNNENVYIRNLLLLFIAGYCLLFNSDLYAVTPDGVQENGLFSIFIVQERWHTGIVFKTDDISSKFWPEVENLKKDFRYLDVGWGDEDFYQVYGFDPILAIKALFVPSSSVLRVVGFNTGIKAYYGRGSTILKLTLDKFTFDNLCKNISNHYALDEKGNTVTSNAFGETRIFYMAKKPYHAFQTCNTWVVSVLRQSGLPIRFIGIITANQLFNELAYLENARFLQHGI